jgi:hypothetical protein
MKRFVTPTEVSNAGSSDGKRFPSASHRRTSNVDGSRPGGVAYPIPYPAADFSSVPEKSTLQRTVNAEVVQVPQQVAEASREVVVSSEITE